MIRFRMFDTWQVIDVTERYKRKGLNVEAKRIGKAWRIYIELPAMLLKQAV